MPGDAHGGATDRGGALLGRPGSGALPPPAARPLGRAAGAQYTLAVGAGGVSVGTRHQPHSARLCVLALRAVEAAEGRPVGAPRACVWGFRGRALSNPRPPVLWGVLPGPLTHWLLVPGVRAWRPVTNPIARSCELALRAVGAVRGRPGGAPLACVWGVRGRVLSHTRPPTLWGMRPGPTTHWPWVRGVWAWGPVTNPTAHALASWLCALWGRHEGARGGPFLPGCGASGVGRSPTLDHPSFGTCSRGPLPTGCGCSVRAWGPSCPWHLLACRGSSSVVRASRVHGTRRP